MTYRIVLRSSALRALTDELPESVAVAVWEFLNGPLAASPAVVGRPLRGPYQGYYGARRGSYRVLYRIDHRDVVVEVVKIDHRRDAYRA